MILWGCQVWDERVLMMHQMVWVMPTTHIAREYGVSDKAIEKFCKKHQIQKPGRGYWAKLYIPKRRKIKLMRLA
jgi:hypothetical protein